MISIINSILTTEYLHPLADEDDDDDDAEGDDDAVAGKEDHQFTIWS